MNSIRNHRAYEVTKGALFLGSTALLGLYEII